MPRIRPIDMTTIDQIFAMENGYVLDFSDRTFAEFFAGELNIDINDDAYHAVARHHRARAQSAETRHAR